VLPLFAYGTLRDPQYQHELFGRTYPMEPAHVSGYIVLSMAGGYLAATQRPGAQIAGALVALDARGYAIADAWEDRTIYDRIEVDAHSATGPRRCFIYIQPAALGAPVTDARLADRPRAEIIDDIRRFRSTLDHRDSP